MLKKLLANKVFIVVLVALLLVAIIIFDSIQGNLVHNLSSPISVAMNPIQTAISGGGNSISDFFAAITDGIAIRQENNELKNRIAELEYQVKVKEEASLRWEELKDAFHIKDSFESYEIFGASILSREADEWFSVIRVAAGNHTGIHISEENPSYAVVDAQMNLVGKVYSADFTSSKVMPVLHEGFTVNAKVNSVNGADVMVHGEVELKEDGLCMVDQIDENAVLKVGDELVTNGLGGLFPAGIPIGVIVSIDDSSPLNRYATMKPYVDIANLNDVFIMIPPTANMEASISPVPTPSENPAGQ